MVAPRVRDGEEDEDEGSAGVVGSDGEVTMAGVLVGLGGCVAAVTAGAAGSGGGVRRIGWCGRVGVWVCSDRWAHLHDSRWWPCCGAADWCALES